MYLAVKEIYMDNLEKYSIFLCILLHYKKYIWTIWKNTQHRKKKEFDKIHRQVKKIPPLVCCSDKLVSVFWLFSVILSLSDSSDSSFSLSVYQLNLWVIYYLPGQQVTYRLQPYKPKINQQFNMLP